MATMERRSGGFGFLLIVAIAAVLLLVAFAVVGNMRGKSHTPYQPPAQPVVSQTSQNQQVMINPTDLQNTMSQLAVVDDVILDLVDGEDFTLAQMLDGVLYAVDGSIAAGASVGILSPSGQFLPIPPFVEEQLRHAAESRGSMLKVLLVYELVRMQPDGLYCGLTSGRCVVTATTHEIGQVAVVFVNGGTATTPVLVRPVTVIFRSRGVPIAPVRMSSCASWQIYPAPMFEVVYEPPPAGSGTCLNNGNTD